MGNFLFIVLHLIAVLFGFVWLMITIPLHLIYAVLRKKPAAKAAEGEPTPDTHVRCPDCRELVRADARRCKHCGVSLVPQNATQ